MITNNDILRISEPVEQMYMDCTSQLIINLCRHFKDGQSLSTAQWEIQKLSELDALTQESVKIIAANTGQSEEVINQAIKEATGIELQDAEKVLSGAAKAGTIQTASSTLATSPAVANVVRTLTEQAVNDTNIVNTVMLNSTRQRYAWAVSEVSQEAALIEQTLNAKNAAELEVQLAKTQRALNTATMTVATGAEARTTALRRVIGQLAAEGITGYIDIAGHQWSPEAYINMDIRTTVHNAAVQAQKDRAAEYGVSTFQISSHLGARPLCAPYQGKFYSWDNTSGVLEDLHGKKYTYQGINTTSYGQPAGIFGINCGHNPQTFVNGYSLARYSPTEDAEENERLYKLTQQQRAYERQIRTNKTKALSYQAAGDKVGFERSAAYIKAENARYKQFCAANGLTPRNDRLQVVGYNHSVSGKVTAVPKIAMLPNAKQVKVPGAKPIPAGTGTNKNIVDTWKRRPDKYDFEIEDIIAAQGFDGKPRVLSGAEFDKAVKEANGGKGFIAQRTYSAPDQYTLDKWREDLYGGKWYVDCGTGGANYGQGMYCAADYNGVLSSGIKNEMRHYMRLNGDRAGGEFASVATKREITQDLIRGAGLTGEQAKAADIYIRVQTKTGTATGEEIKFVNQVLGREGMQSLNTAVSIVNNSFENCRTYVETMTLDPSAKIIGYTDLLKMYNAEGKLKFSDPGSYAAALGYDAINVFGHGESGSYTIILNRTKVILKGGFL